MKKHFFFSFFFLLFCQTMIFGQGPGITNTKKNLQPKVQVTFAQKLGTTAPLKELVPIQTSNRSKKKLAKKHKQAPKDFKNRGSNKVVKPELEHQGIDVIRQKAFNAQYSTSVTPSVNINGLTSGIAPNDPTGDAGKNHYLQAINFTTIGVYDKRGNLLNTFEGNTLWSTLGFFSAGDPIVLYDQSLDRWIITEFPDENELLIAVSVDSDPMGSYDVYNFSTPEFPDYPKYGIWDDVITVTTNEGSPGSQSIYIIDKLALMSGVNNPAIQRIELPGSNNTEAGFFVSTPVDWTGQNEPTDGPSFIILNDSSWGDTDEDQVEIYTVNANFENSDSTTFDQTSVVLSPFDGFPCSAVGFGFQCVPQLGGGGLDAIPEVIMNQPHYRNFITHESMVFNFITDVTDGENLSGIRWVELRKTPDTDWSLYQEGTFAPDDGLDRFMGSICMDGLGNIGLAYNVTSPDSYVGVRFTGRRVNDPLGEMTIDEYIIAEGTNTIFSGGRFGDYAHMSIDPIDDKTFWFTTEYANGDDGGDVNTSITAFSIQLDTIDIGPSAIITPQNAANLSEAEVITIEVVNFGLDTQQVFQVGYIFENEPPIIESVNFLLLPDSTYEHTFSPTVDMSAIGDYSFTIFTNLENDKVIFNDTLTTIISNIPNTDASISSILGVDGIICSESFPANIILTNNGAAILNTTTITISLNGMAYQTINWTGDLETGANDTIPITIDGLSQAINQISVTSSLPNQLADEIPENDTFIKDFSILFDVVSVFLNLTLDDFPEETSWEITDSMGAIIYKGGPYNQPGRLITEELCLSESSCYTFTIFDALEDGLCCDFGFGSYNVTNAEGEILISSNGRFAGREVTEFCPVFTCRLSGDISISSASTANSTDGVLFITAANGSDPIEYSIDGGVTFQSNRIFNNLVSGSYKVVIKDDNDCVYEEEVMVDFTTSTKELESNYDIIVFPNPTDGVMNLEVSGVSHSGVYLDLEIYNALGKRMHNTNLTKYGDNYIGQVSLYHYPAGTYFIRFVNEDIAQMLRVVRK